MKKVLEKMTKQERKKLNRCLNDRTPLFLKGPVFNEKMAISLFFLKPCNEFRNFKRVLAAIYYSISREKVRNKKEFSIDINFISDNISHSEINNYEMIQNGFKESYKIKSNNLFSSKSLFYLDILTNIYTSTELSLFFKDGNFCEEQPKNINNGCLFKSDSCVVCFEAAPNILFVDCGHIPICCVCFKNFTYVKNFNIKCPLCKTENYIINEL